ncbi:MAG: folate-binding protein [Sphingomonas bacterium]|nr:folate-binding protein [Sphingomonas bacterium]
MAETTLTDRVLLRLTGEDVHGFLDGLVTNSLDTLPAYAALLTPQGKVIADFIVWSDGDDLLLDCDMAAAEALERRLAMYRLRRPITIARDEGLAVHWSPDGADDPRLVALGRRWITAPGDPASGWREHRLRLGVCEGAGELGDLLWLECNADELNGVSFTKGCFVGQENTARMNWRGKVNRRLFVVPSGIAPQARVRIDYPEFGLAVAHLRVDEVPAEAIRPTWLQLNA